MNSKSPHEAVPVLEATKNPIQIHATTLPHLDLIEKILLDELIKQGRAEVIPAGTEAA